MANKTKKTQAKKGTTTYKPTKIALGKDAKGKLHVLIGSRRIDSFKGEVVDRTERFWSQLKYLAIGKDKAGKFHLTSAREAAAKGYALVE
jgi:hypothetical protein